MRAAAVSFVALLAVPLFAQSPAPVDGRPPILRQVSIEQRLGRTLPLDTVSGTSRRLVKLGDYFGRRPVVLVLAYYDCPMLCTQVLNGLVSAMRILSFDAGRDYDVVTVSFDPRDDPSDARAKKEPYVARYGRPGAAKGWHFLTGEKRAIDKLAGPSGSSTRGTRNRAVRARKCHLRRDPRRKLSGTFTGSSTPPGPAARPRRGVAGKIGNPVDQLLLYCYHYDPAAGATGPP